MVSPKFLTYCIALEITEKLVTLTIEKLTTPAYNVQVCFRFSLSKKRMGTRDDGEVDDKQPLWPEMICKGGFRFCHLPSKKRMEVGSSRGSCRLGDRLIGLTHVRL